MAEELMIKGNTREELYLGLLPQIKALTQDENDLIANLSNICAALKQTFNFFWVGFYLVKNNELVLGPFQGNIACTRIAYGKGVCGTAWKEQKTIIVQDVDAFPGHIACSSLSKSEIVVPIFNKQNQIKIVLDIDSDKLNDFNETDKIQLEKLAHLIQQLID